MIIITRHKGIIEFLAQHNITGEVITHVENIEQIAGKDVCGILPIVMAAHTNSITTIGFTHLPEEMRGKELTLEQMHKYGAYLEKFQVVKLS